MMPSTAVPDRWSSSLQVGQTRSSALGIPSFPEVGEDLPSRESRVCPALQFAR
jgi:hypothetical protein